MLPTELITSRALRLYEVRFDHDNAQRDTTLPASVRFALTLPKYICLIPGLAHRALLRFPRQVVGLVSCMSVAAGTASTLFLAFARTLNWIERSM